MNEATRRLRPLLLVGLIAGLAIPRAPAIAEWRIETTARVPGETGLTEVFVGGSPRADRAAAEGVAPRYASGKIRRAPVEEAVIRRVAAIVDAPLPGAAVEPAAGPQQSDEASPQLLADSESVADGTLDALRGGFETAGGLQLSFGIERLVYVNGELASVTSINVADLGKLSGGAAAATGLASGASIALIQNGMNNAFAAGELNAAALATVIQNSLDNQRIQAVTTISATVNSMEMLRAHRLQQTLQDALNQSLLR